MDFCDGGDLYSRMTNQRGVLFPEDKVGLLVSSLTFCIFSTISFKHLEILRARYSNDCRISYNRDPKLFFNVKIKVKCKVNELSDFSAEIISFYS
jgi:hypothetical protein